MTVKFPNAPGIQYPAELVESNKTDAALKMLVDNTFYLRGCINLLADHSDSTITRQQLQQLVTQIITNTVINMTGATFSVGTHVTRLTTPATLGAAFLETDRNAIYVGSDASGTLQWVWAGGNMVSGLSSIPGDLSTSDIGFLFTESDSGMQSQYAWDGTKFVTVGGYLQDIKDAVTNAISTVIVRKHSSSGLAATGFGGGVVDQLQDAGGGGQTAAYKTVEWTAAGSGTNTAMQRWWLRVAGVLTQAIELVSTGWTLLLGNIFWKSGTNFTGELNHANTANRTYTYPDATGNVALVSDDAYSGGWSGVANISPSQNAVYNEIESVVAAVNTKVSGTGINFGPAPVASITVVDGLITNIS